MARASESDIVRTGKEIFERMKGQTPSVFNKDWWSGKVMDFAMKDEAFKVEMFRFVDVFPTLKDHVQVAEHLQEYFCRPEQDFPASFQWGLSRVKPDSMVAKMAAKQIEKQMIGMATKFIAGTSADEAMPALRDMWKSNLAFTLDLLGEATVSESEAASYFDRYDEILDTLIEQTRDWPQNSQLEQASWGPIPRVNVSVKISSLYSQIDPVDFEGSIDSLKDRLRPLFRKAQKNGAFINLDMEHYDYKNLTIAVFKSLLSEPEFQDFEHAGIALQAYLRDAEEDVTDLSKWAKKRKTPVTVRLIKGAYWDYETIHSEQEGWQNPVWSQKWETDRCFEACTEILLDHKKYIRLAIGSHNVRSIAHAIEYAKARRLPVEDLEFQMLYGMAEPMKAALAEMGYRVREYVPIGEMIPGMAYLVRRLLENTSNESWLRQTYADGVSVDTLLEAPGGRDKTVSTGREHLKALNAEGFRNHPMLNFAKEEHRQAFRSGMQTFEKRLGQTYPIVIGGQTLNAERALKSISPNDAQTVVGSVHMANVEIAERAVATARSVASSWAATDPSERADHLFAIARELDRRRCELAACIVHEVGKSWHGADADVCEAIDFCVYYGLEMKRLARGQKLGDMAGESNQLFYRPRGVAAVIAPWNFPLAILTGMTMAAVVTGNPVVMKPAEQSPVIAALLMEACQAAGLPAGVVNFVPGYGEDVGAHLVQHPDVDLVAFTGSMAVGLKIVEAAGVTRPGQRQVKKVICEMGGKNAIVVDADADLDEAVQGVVNSAFGFQGQKCSACSRVIVHDSCYEEFRERLVEATRSLEIGPSTDPAYTVGPVVDEEARESIRGYIEIARKEGTVLVSREVPSKGTFVGPTLVEGLAADSRISQEEIFGPVLALYRVPDFATGLKLANQTRFALTGAVYSRSPLNLDRARREFEVGNLYINCGSTGALVYRQPFGGFNMSGIGTKAGGPNYLEQFMVSRSISENTMRRGFAPME